MANATNKFQVLTDEEKAEFKKGLKAFMDQQEEIDNLKESQRDTVKDTSSKIEGLSKKEVKKLFTYFRKNISPSDLRDDAAILEEAQNLANS